ncbi:hypothetical protein H310_15041 [Aphanomyces invadans]|uniref:Uncharacterized protein n=1 Tax=Aphanomyces invadans TaxID=157072 RepID=A0A024T921_9STRA|nr:hypothetical protein H310_15041 [Aphanomyces invadans]ETV90126.1 hypothetical protein H310_15041 [Aphanomyces invadans]|eukprot:XP_008881241.1 hypothetical protein H310_15041 [Aphanomyces invadans]
MSIQSKVKATLTNLPSATLFGLYFAPTPNMINSPTNNTIVYNIAYHTAITVDLVKAALDSVVTSANPSASCKLVYASTIGDTTNYVVERSLEATTATDVVITVPATRPVRAGIHPERLCAER